MRKTSSCACHGRTSAQIQLLLMSSQASHIGKGSLITTIPTRSLTLIGTPIHLSTVGVPFKRSAIGFKDAMRILSVSIQVAYHTRSISLKHIHCLQSLRTKSPSGFFIVGSR